MLKSDFSNYTGLYGRGPYIARELLGLVEAAEQHPQTAAQLETLFNADVARVQAALTAAKTRSESSGPGGGPLAAPAATAISLTPATAEINITETQQLTAVVTPSNAAGTTTYSSSAPSVATVSTTGLVTGVGEGSATITATRGSVTDTSVVSVTDGL